jgi:hypothetical protein
MVSLVFPDLVIFVSFLFKQKHVNSKTILRAPKMENKNSLSLAHLLLLLLLSLHL